MNFKEYTTEVMRTVNVLDTPIMNQLHMVLGMVTESSEIANVFKATIAYGREIDWVNVKEELGDLLFFITAFCEMNDLDLDEIMKKNIAKLYKRYPERFTTENANNRNLGKERKVLEDTYDYIQDDLNFDAEREIHGR